MSRNVVWMVVQKFHAAFYPSWNKEIIVWNISDVGGRHLPSKNIEDFTGELSRKVVVATI